jgi:hypothetical protein
MQLEELEREEDKDKKYEMEKGSFLFNCQVQAHADTAGRHALPSPFPCDIAASDARPTRTCPGSREAGRVRAGLRSGAAPAGSGPEQKAPAAGLGCNEAA